MTTEMKPCAKLTGMCEQYPLCACGVAAKKQRTAQMREESRRVVVCGACFRASCWQGHFYCKEYKTAGTANVSVAWLRHKNLESSDYWKSFDTDITSEREGTGMSKLGRIRKRCGYRPNPPRCRTCAHFVRAHITLRDSLPTMQPAKCGLHGFIVVPRGTCNDWEVKS